MSLSAQQPALVEAAGRGDAVRVAALLRVAPQLACLTDQSGCSALQRAAADGHADVVQLLLQHATHSNHSAHPALVDIHQQDHVHGNTALHEAAWKGYSRCVSLLCAHDVAGAGSGLCVRNAGGFAPLHLACQNGHNQSCRELLLAGADPNVRNNYGDTSLHTAARYGHAGVTRILISAQCKVSEQNKNGDTALHIAAAMGRRKLTRILLEAGCDKSLKNHQGETARDIATRKGLEEIINILNTPIAKQLRKKDKNRDKSKERTLDDPDNAKKLDSCKEKKKKNVHFEKSPPVQWSPYGCHYYPDPKYFPKPKLSSLPTEPLKKGEQYYLDLAGNIKKGPIGAGYTCYCAPFFKHMEEKLNEDKKDLKRHIDRAHDRLDQKVTDLEMKTQGQISELTRFVAVERAMCSERHQHLEQWLTRGIMFRASERLRKLNYSPNGSLNIPPLKRTRSLELLDKHAEEWNKVDKLIRSFNNNSEQNENYTKELNMDKATSRSTEVLETRKSHSPRRHLLKNSKSSDHLDARTSNCSRPLHTSYTSPMEEINPCQNTAEETHTKSSDTSMSRTELSIKEYNERLAAPSLQPNSISPMSSNIHSQYRNNNSDGDHKGRNIQHEISQEVPIWKSQVLVRTSNDLRKRIMLDQELCEVINKTKPMDISQDGYVKLPKQEMYDTREDSNIEREPIRPVQELVAKAELQQICNNVDSMPLSRILIPTEIQEPATSPLNIKPSPGILKMPQQPQRPAPVLKEKPPKSKRFSLHNLIPFPTRKTFQNQSKDNGNNSESSDEDDNPIRSSQHPGPMSNTNLLQTLPLPNYESISNKSQSPAPQFQKSQMSCHDVRPVIPKDAYFHDISNRKMHLQLPYRDITEKSPPLPQTSQYIHNPNRYDYNQSGLPESQLARNRNPLYQPQTGVFDAMMQDHMVREMDRIPHCYSDHLDQNTEVEISNHHNFRTPYYDNRPYSNFRNPHIVTKKPIPDHNLLHSRLQSLAINTHFTETQSQADRESHNDSGYSTKVYGSSQGPSPSLSGHVEGSDNMSGQRINIGNVKSVRTMNTSSLV